MIQYLSVFGSSAYWMLHSPTIPMCLMTFRAVLRNLKYSRFDNVCEGATTIDYHRMNPRRIKVLHVADRDAVVDARRDDLRSRERVSRRARPQPHGVASMAQSSKLFLA